MPAPGFLRRLGGVLYEALAVAALWLLASAIVTSILGNAVRGEARLLLQIVSLATISGYFLWCWTHGGQTLAMKAWRMRVVDAGGASLSWSNAGLRLMLATAGILLGGIGLWWALLDKEGQFLHDRLAGTRLTLVDVSR